MIGTPPPGHLIDHINRDRLDNRRSNLRFLTFSESNMNRTLNKCSKYGVGVRKYRGRYNARVKRNRVEIHLGTFDTPEEAHEARRLFLDPHAAPSATRSSPLTSVTSHPSNIREGWSGPPMSNVEVFSQGNAVILITPSGDAQQRFIPLNVSEAHDLVCRILSAVEQAKGHTEASDAQKNLGPKPKPPRPRR
ncbi:HNH endonuclease [Streptomyces sp. NPDC055085]